jgi:hypothetical protein
LKARAAPPVGGRADYQLTEQIMDNHHSEDFGNLPNPSETFGTIPNASEPFRTVRNTSEKKENHTVTVREAARLFEQAGVPRTERSIINWCRINRQGVARLDAFFDENEGRYYITPESVTRAIEEERAKQTATGAAPVAESEMPKRSETPPRQDAESSDRVKELELKNRDLEITNRAKDFFIGQLKTEHRQNFERLVGMSRYVGELETQLLQLGGASRHDRSLPNSSEEFGATSHRAEPTRNDASFPQGGVAL